jgi:hypothetical protein
VADIASISGGFPPFIFEYSSKFRDFTVNFPYALIMVDLLKGY